MSSSLPVECKCKLVACRRTRDFRVDAKLDPPVAAFQWQHAFMPSQTATFVVIVVDFSFTCVYRFCLAHQSGLHVLKFLLLMISVALSCV